MREMLASFYVYDYFLSKVLNHYNYLNIHAALITAITKVNIVMLTIMAVYSS